MNTAIVILFFLVMLLIGILSARKIGGTVSYYVADRKGSVPVITGSLVATAVGGSSTIGLAGLGYTRGLVGAWWLLVGVIGLGVLAFWFVEKVRAFEVFTLPEILERQYGGQTVKIVASLLIVIAWLGIIAAQILAGQGRPHALLGTASHTAQVAVGAHQGTILALGGAGNVGSRDVILDQ